MLKYKIIFRILIFRFRASTYIRTTRTCVDIKFILFHKYYADFKLIICFRQLIQNCKIYKITIVITNMQTCVPSILIQKSYYMYIAKLICLNIRINESKVSFAVQRIN